jgi:hypothetical protein
MIDGFATSRSVGSVFTMSWSRAAFKVWRKSHKSSGDLILAFMGMVEHPNREASSITNKQAYTPAP